MCYHLAITKKRDYIEKRFGSDFVDTGVFEPIYHASAFSTPLIPVILNSDRKHINMLQWGLIPFWVKDDERAGKIRFKTFNARAETLYERSSYKYSVKKKRCLVIVDGFYEWREVNGKKYPYYIHMKGNKIFTLAGLWDSWDKGEIVGMHDTFSVITTRANPLLERIHNRKKRMPAILKKDDEDRWLDDDLSKEETEELLQPIDDKDMEAHTISKFITSRGVNTNVPKVIEKFDYEGVEL